MKPDAPAPDQRPAITVAPRTAAPGTVTLTRNGRTLATVECWEGEDLGALAERLAEASQESLRPSDVTALAAELGALNEEVARVAVAPIDQIVWTGKVTI